MYTLEDCLLLAKSVLAQTGAFVRVSRSKGLLVTDAGRHPECDDTAREALLKHFQLEEENGLIYLTPSEILVDSETNANYIAILKAAPDLKEKIVRTALSVAMREKNAHRICFYTALLERMTANED